MQPANRRDFVLTFVALGLLGCGASNTAAPAAAATTTPAATPSETTFVSSWKSPTAQPLQVQGAKVAAVVIMSDVATRRTAEDALASELTKRGAEGVPMYSLVNEGVQGGEPVGRNALEQAGIRGVVVLHPGPVEQQAKAIDYNQPPYQSYFGGYAEYAWDYPWPVTPPNNQEAVVSVDTMIYSLAQNQLVWAGKSKTTNPASLPGLISEVVVATAKELQQIALLPQ